MLAKVLVEAEHGIHIYSLEWLIYVVILTTVWCQDSLDDFFFDSRVV